MNIEQKQRALLKQLKFDLKTGESSEVEFKGFQLEHLNSPKTLNKHRFSLGKNLASFAERGGRLYIGIDNDGKVVGVKGTCQFWQEKLIEKALDDISDDIDHQVALIKEPQSKKQVIRIEVKAGGEIIRHQKIYVIRNGTRSKEATQKEIEKRQSIKDELGWVLETTLDCIKAVNQHEEKFKNLKPWRESVDYDLECVREKIRDELHTLKSVHRIFPEMIDKLTEISKSIKRLSFNTLHVRS